MADPIAEIDPGTWRPARTVDGEKRTGTYVAEIDVVPAGLPAGTRVIVRREKAHPGAQLKLWDSGPWRYQCVLTNQTGDCVTLEARHRAHARVENHIKALKDSGLERVPYTTRDANGVWFACVLAARTLTCWLQHQILDGDLTTAMPETLCYRLLHMPARIVSHARRLRLRLDRAWPRTPAALAGYDRLDRLLVT